MLGVGVGGVLLLAVASRGAEPAPSLPLLLLLLGAVLLDAFPLSMPNGAAMSLAFGMVLTAQLLFGTVAAALVHVFGHVIGYGLLNRRPWDRTLFNAGQLTLAVLAAGSIASWLGLHPWPDATGIRIPPLHLVLVYIAIYWIINNLLVGLALYSQQSPPADEFVRFLAGWLPIDALSTAIAVATHSVVMIAYQVYGVAGMGAGIVLALMVNHLLRLHMSLVEAHQDLQALYDITRGLAGVLELDDAVRWVARAVHQLAPCDAFALYLVAEEDTLRVHYAAHPEAAVLQGRMAGEGAVRKAAATRHAIQGQEEPSLVTPGFSPLDTLAVPLVADDRLMGCLCLARQHRFFGEREARLLSIVASAMAMAIQNALVYGRTQTLAQTDPMTGLYNYRYFSLRLREALRRAGATHQPLSLILIDLDNFSEINNQFGHQTGDEVLRQFAGILRSSVRQQDVVARYAGDEFVAILPQAGREEAEMVARRIREAASAHRFTSAEGQEVPLRFSLGVAVYPFDAASDTELIAAADRHMYRDKRFRRDP